MKKVMTGLIGCFLLALTTTGWSQSAHLASGSRKALHRSDRDVAARDTVPANTLDTMYRYHSTDTADQAKDSIISLTDPATVSKKDTTPVAPTPVTVKTEMISLDKPDTTVQPRTDAPVQPKADAPAQPAPQTDPAAQTAQNTAPAPSRPPVDTATKEDRAEEQKRELDRRWFIAPGTKFQFQDFALLEKNRKGYLSDANTLSFFQRGNFSFAASAYKNLTNRLSISADIGFSFGHATNNDVLISQTKSKTYNLLNAAVYYHLIGPSYRLQPYVTVGFNDIVNDQSYPTVPLGIGAKFNSKKIMVLGQVTYGQSIAKSIASTTMYSLGIYIPVRSKKQKQLEQEENNSKFDKKDEAKKKDTANKNGHGDVTNNIYITINMDSVLKAKGLLDENGNPINGGKGGNSTADDDEEGGSNKATAARKRHKKTFRNMGLDDFNDADYHLDSLDGKPVLRFIVYFEFNEYGLNSKAFANIDKVISHLQRSSEFSVEIKGYTDSVGTDQYNNMLSRKRAKMVLDYMNSRGIPAELMKAKAYGSDSPVADNGDPNQAWLNRRAEIIVHKKELAAQ